jgi:hypothetical protein
LKFRFESSATDCAVKPFSEHLTTIDVSLHGAKLRGLKAKLQLDEIIGLTYGKSKGHFRVKWIGTPGTATEDVMGLLNLNPGKPLWDFPISELATETADIQAIGEPALAASKVLGFSRTAGSWRGSALGESLGPEPRRMLHRDGYPITQSHQFAIALWLGDAKLHLQGQVVSVQAGFGNGVRFLGLTSEHQEHLRRFIETIAPPEVAGIALAKGSGV